MTLTFASTAQTFYRTYGLPNTDRGTSVMKLPNGDYVVCGITASSGAGSDDYFIMRTDPSGNIIWSNTYGSAGMEESYAACVSYTSDGSILFSASTRGYGQTQVRDGMLIKLTTAGSVIWERRIGHGNSEHCRGARELSNGDYLVIGSSGNPGFGSDDGWMARFNSSGTQIWGYAYGSTNNDQFNDFIPYKNGDVLVALRTMSFGSGNAAPGVARIDKQGNMLWMKMYDGPAGQERASSIALTPDSGAIIGGLTEAYGAGGADGFLARVDSVGNLLWYRTYGSSGQDDILMIESMSDSTYIVGGYTESSGGHGSRDIFFMNIDENGNIIWQKAFGNSLFQDVGFQHFASAGMEFVLDEANNELVFTGETDSLGHGRDVVLVRIKTDGTGVCNSKNLNLLTSSHSPNVANISFNRAPRNNIVSVNSTVLPFNVNAHVPCFTPGSCIDSAVIIPDKNQICGNDSIFMGNFSIGFGPWQWYDNGVLFSTNVNPYWTSTVNGTHIIRLIAGTGQCADTMEIIVERHDSLVADAGVGPLLICPNDSVQIGGSPTVNGGTGPVFINWFPGAGLDNPTSSNPMASPGSTTWYTVQLVDSVGCQGEDSIEVVVTSPPAADAGGGSGASFFFCIEDSAQLGGAPTGSGGTGPLTYQWTPGTGLTGTTITNPWASPSTTTTYYVTVTDSLGCIGMDSVVVNVWQTPVIDTSGLVWSSATCDSINGFIQGITATGTPTLGYQWYLGSSAFSTTQNISGLNVGTYKLVVTDGNGCTDSIDFVIGQLGKPQLGTLHTIPNTCDSINGAAWVSGVNGGSPPYTYQWTDGSNNLGTDTVITPVDSGLYFITVTDTNGCILDTNVLVGRTQLPYVVANFDSASTFVNQSVTKNIYVNDTGLVTTISIVTPPISGTATVDNAGNMTYTPFQNYVGYDYFYYTICDPTCPYVCDTAQVLINVKDQIPLFVPTGFSPNGDGYNDNFHIIGIAFYPENTITIFNRWGDEVYEASPYNNEWVGFHKKSGKAVTDGTYYYILRLTPASDQLKGPIELRR